MNDEYFMKQAIRRAKLAEKDGEVPVGAVIVKDGVIISSGRNRREKRKNALCHAEIEAINRACKKMGTWRLEDCVLYVTHEPCVMCAGACVGARIKRIVYGSTDKRFGAFGSAFDLSSVPLGSKYSVTKGVCGDECAEMLSNFFKKLRSSKNN